MVLAVVFGGVLVKGHGSVDIVCVGVDIVGVGCVVDNNRCTLLHARVDGGLLLHPIEAGWLLLHPIEAGWLLLHPIEAGRLLLHPIEAGRLLHANEDGGH